MKHPHAALVERWFEEVWNQGKTSTIDELLPPDGLVHGLDPGGGAVRGPAGFKVFFQTLRDSFPDIKVTVADTVAAGDMVAGRWSATMTHTGDSLGIPATHRPVRITGMCMARIVDGKIKECWNNWDTMALMEQLGAVAKVKLS